MKLGLPLPVREKELAEIQATKSDKTYGFQFQGKQIYFPIYRVRIELPKYRLENGRTQAAQRDYIAKEGVEAEFFDPSRSENDAVQEVQHTLLIALARSSDPDKDLFKFFSKNEQEQPLILDGKGIVVNGNRRLAALREIRKEIPEKFSHIDVVVLPPCDPRDIDELEVRLQVNKDIKQDYTWYSIALLLRSKLTLGQYSEKQLAELFDFSVKDVRDLLQKLNLGEEYLASRNISGQYLKLDGTEFAFNKLLNTSNKIASAEEKNFFNEVSFKLIDSKEGGRVYSSIPEAFEVIDQIHSALREDVLSEEVAQIEDALRKSGSKDADIFGTVDESGIKYQAVAQALKESDKTTEILDVIQNEIEAKKARDRSHKVANSALKKVREANTALADALTALNVNSKVDGILPQLKMITQRVEEIAARINAIKKKR